MSFRTLKKTHSSRALKKMQTAREFTKYCEVCKLITVHDGGVNDDYDYCLEHDNEVYDNIGKDFEGEN